MLKVSGGRRSKEETSSHAALCAVILPVKISEHTFFGGVRPGRKKGGREGEEKAQPIQREHKHLFFWDRRRKGKKKPREIII